LINGSAVLQNVYSDESKNEGFASFWHCDDMRY